MSSERWWYLDADGKSQGPWDAAALVNVFSTCGVPERVRNTTPPPSPVAGGPPADDGGGWQDVSAFPGISLVRRGASKGAMLTPPIPSRANGAVEAGRNVLGAPAEEVAAPASTAGGANSGFVLPSPSEMMPPQSVAPPPPSLPGTLPARPPADPDGGRAAARDERKVSRKRMRALQSARDRAARSLYVTGVPEGADARELAQFFAKCGILMVDGRTGQPSVAIYEDGDGRRKGDARVTYAMPASVENALLLLDGVPLRDGGAALRVERVEYDEAKELARLAPAGAAGSGEGARKRQRSGPGLSGGAGGRAVVREALGWAEEDQTAGKGTMRMVVLRNMFDPAAPDCDYAALREDLERGCGSCGAIEKLHVFEGNADGVVLVKFQDGGGARRCIDVMHGRWYDRRKVDAEYYDGVTDYRVKETAAERAEREAKWQAWLGGEDEGE